MCSSSNSRLTQPRGHAAAKPTSIQGSKLHMRTLSSLSSAGDGSSRKSLEARLSLCVLTCTSSAWILSNGSEADQVTRIRSVLAVLIGYLVADVAFFQLNWKGLVSSVSIMVLEDALTISWLLGMLCCGSESASASTEVVFAVIAKISAKLIGYTALTWPAAVRDPAPLISELQSVATTVSAEESSVSSSDNSCVDDTVATADSHKGLSKHMDKSLWYIHGNAYDLNSFVANHPGGKEALLLGKGRDCTAMFESYHALHLRKKHWTILEKYRADKADNMRRPVDPFYETLQIRVAKVLESNGIDPVDDRAATPQRAAYYVTILVCWAYCGYMHVKGSIIASFFFAIFGWLMGALGHDAGHFSASRYAWVNEWGVWAMSLICNPIQWQHQHTYSHHSFTNEFDSDPDLHHFHMFLRVHKRIQHDNKLHKYQSRWWFVLLSYVFVVFGTCVWIPWGMLETGTLYGIVDWHDKDRWTKAIGMRVHLAMYLLVVVIFPMVFSPSSQIRAMFGAYLHVATLGVIFALFSQINHLTENSLESDMETRRERADDHKHAAMLRNSWAAAQVETSNNFASCSPLWHFLSNGLNHQIEHHLFPGLNHCHLPIIAPVVRETCIEYGVRYESFDTWSDVVNATLAWLDQLSVDENTNECYAVKQE